MSLTVSFISKQQFMYQTDKSHQYFTLIRMHIFFCNRNTFYAYFGTVIDVDGIG